MHAINPFFDRRVIFTGVMKQVDILGHCSHLLFQTLLVFQKFPGVDGTLQPAWKAIWLFSVQLISYLAALALLTFVVFLKAK